MQRTLFTEKKKTYKKIYKLLIIKEVKVKTINETFFISQISKHWLYSVLNKAVRKLSLTLSIGL